MIPLPEQAWQLPAIAVVLLLVIGYLLWTNREQRREAEAERKTSQAFLQSLVDSNDKERRDSTKCFIELVERTTQAQEKTASAIKDIVDTLATELGNHDSRAAERHGQAMAELRALRPAGGVAVRYPKKAGGDRAD